MGVTRRELFRLGMFAGGYALLPHGRVFAARRARRDGEPPPTPFTWNPFTVEMPTGKPFLQPSPLNPPPGSLECALGSSYVFHGIAPEFHPAHPTHCPDWDLHPLKTYEITMEEFTGEILPGVPTPGLFGYNGQSPGPTIRARFGEPVVIRQTNHLDVETSVHLHGSHAPAHADGFPEFYVLPWRRRDYYYPNIVERVGAGSACDEPFDVSRIPSTMWYHDHGGDLTGFNVSRGLAGFYLLTDDLEEGLMASGVLPHIEGDFDIPLAVGDTRLNSDGSLFYDFLDHNGFLGDVPVVNGKAQPFFVVQRRKYRFRILNDANARIRHLRLSTGQPFLVIGTDSWLLPFAHPVGSFQLAMAERHDVIIDFSDAPDEVFLEDIAVQEDGRGPSGLDPSNPTPLLKFVVVGGNVPNDVTVEPGTELRQNIPILPSEVVKTRHFVFERKHGAWVINGQFFSPRRADAVPRLGAAERWILENKSNGWWHPIHIHLVSHQIEKLNGAIPPFQRRFKVDVSTLTGNGVAEILIRFATFRGPFVFHCHNLEHEDMRMMGVVDPTPAGEMSFLNGVVKPPACISGIPEEFEPFDELRFDELADVDRIFGRGVGFPLGDFEPGGETTPPP